MMERHFSSPRKHTSRMSKLTVEALEQHHDTSQRTRRPSIAHKEGSDSTGLNVTGPNLRRMSKVGDRRMSLQPGLYGRRFSQASRTSISGSMGAKQIGMPIKLQNTYKMEPDPGEKFQSSKVEKIMSSVLESYLDGEKYDAKLCSHLAQNLTDVIKDRVKEIGFHRYKLICNVMIGQNAAQGMRVASRCLWNESTDSFASAKYSKGQLFATATLYAVYFE